MVQVMGHQRKGEAMNNPYALHTRSKHYREEAQMVRPQGRPERQSGAPTRIVILGGGFAGATTAEHLERAFGADPSVEVTLVSDTSTLLFTPMLAQVASG